MNPIQDLSTRDLVGKTVLEVGSGRGDTTRNLVSLLAGKPGARLIATDLSDDHFARLGAEFAGSGVQVDFLRTEAQNLIGVPDGSVDYLVCNYTLCAVEARAGSTLQALGRFHETLRTRGEIFIEEEFPIDVAANPAQKVWAEKWRLLKAATELTGGAPFHEFAPEELAELVRRVGFINIQWAADSSFLPEPHALQFFHARLERLMAAFPSPRLRDGFASSAVVLDEMASRAGGMEIPFYRLTAHKSRGTASLHATFDPHPHSEEESCSSPSPARSAVRSSTAN
ncbi:MAG: class I SAM-dependent methyltransferase [Anaerolineales bacterium]|nr:class I SAM-dependent methyltransferase [Anaerolineales bacterium]